jgi:hypothetical protein
MPIPLDAPEVLNRELPEIRARLLQLAAALDRMDRAAGSGNGGSVDADARRRTIDEGLRLLLTAGADRAERIQRLFSLPYDPNWKDKFAHTPRT